MGDSNKENLPLASLTSLIMDSGLRPMSSLDSCSAPSCFPHLAPSSCSFSSFYQPVFLSALPLRPLHVCGCTCVCVWVQVCVCVCVSANICNECVGKCVHVCVRVWVYVHTHKGESLCGLCKQICRVSVHMRMLTYVCVHICMYMCVCVYVCLCMDESPHGCECLWAHGEIYVCIYVYRWICIHVSVCIYAHRWVYVSGCVHCMWAHVYAV